MSLDNVLERHQIKYGRDEIHYEQNQISYSLSSERQFIIDTISEEFPDYDKEVIEVNVNYCCSQSTSPCPTKVFFEYVLEMCEKQRNK